MAELDIAKLSKEDLLKLDKSQIEELFSTIQAVKREKSAEIDDDTFKRYVENIENSVNTILAIYKRLLVANVSEEKLGDIQDIIDKVSKKNIKANAEQVKFSLRGRPLKKR